MKLAVMSIAIGERYSALSSITFPLIKAYADRVGADFVPITERCWPNPSFEKLHISKLLNKYHRVLYVDADVLIRSDCPNLFEMVPTTEIGLFDEDQFVDHKNDKQDIVKETNQSVEKWNHYYNLGVIIASREHKFIFTPPSKEVKNINALINLRIARSDIKTYELSHKFNRMNFIDNLNLIGEHRRASYVVHYRGANGSLPLQNQVAMMTDDIEDWKKNPTFEYKKNILVKVHGGLGDEICAEPVIRYMTEKVYKGANIVVASWFPRIFAHLPVRNVDIRNYALEKDVPYYTMNTLAPEGHLAWLVASPNLMNVTDYISLMCLRMTLPNEYKQIKLVADLNEVSELIQVVGMRPLSEAILVHPGRGWPSKTFPAEYWSAIIAGLASAGRQVIVIGREMNDDQGTMQLQLPPGVIDTRNLLDLGALIVLISQAKVLISNDSSPVHIAGAFDNHIILIPTCKHPDHVLPFRHGRYNYRATSLYKELYWNEIDSSPARLGNQTINQVGDITRYIPDVAKVVSVVLAAYEEK